MSTREVNRKFDCDSFDESENDVAKKDDLVELVLGPLGDQIDQSRLETVAAITNCEIKFLHYNLRKVAASGKK